MKPIFILLSALIFSISCFSQEEEEKDPQNMIVVVDQEAHYAAGEMAMYQYIYQNIKWPDYKDKVINQTMMISFNVETDSSLTDIEVMGGVDPLVDKAVISVLKTMKFAPSVQMGTAVKMNLMINIPIRKRFD